MSTSRNLLATLLVSAIPSLALADSSGVYGAGGLGGNFLSDSDLDGSGVNNSVDFDAGWVGSISLGYGFNNGDRIGRPSVFGRRPIRFRIANQHDQRQGGEAGQRKQREGVDITDHRRLARDLATYLGKPGGALGIP